LRKILENIWRIITPAERGRFNKLVILHILVTITDIVALAFLLLIIQFYIQPDMPSLLDQFPEWLRDRNSILPIALCLLLFALKNLAAYLVHKAQFTYVYSVATRLAEKNLTQYLAGNYQEHVSKDSSVFVRRVQQQPIEFCHHVLSGMQVVITQSVLVAFTVIAILIFNPALFFLLLLILLPPVIFVGMMIKKRMQHTRSLTQSSSEGSIRYLKEALAGFVESKMYGRQDFFRKRYISKQSVFNNHLAELQIVQGIPARLIEVFAILGLVIVMTLSRTLTNQGVDLITIGAFMAAAYKIIPGFVKIINASVQIHAYEFTIPDLLENRSSHAAEARPALPIQNITFNNVSFNYKDQAIFNNLNIAISKGDFAGITGRSGIGKTTLIHLLLGFLEAESGEIGINGNNVSADQRESYWTDISYVKQQSFLIHDSIVNNITLGELPYDRERLAEVIRITGLDEWMDKRPEGWDYVIAEDGKDISGGQRQRIALARALYKRSGVFILDEPFNELDDAAEKRILAYFSQLTAEGKIVILVTHNRESFAFCNKIISLD
jgi:ABC-type bacteriocin/lantibiotic exporter with double-glycine peptidase domain